MLVKSAWGNSDEGTAVEVPLFETELASEVWFGSLGEAADAGGVGGDEVLSLGGGDGGVITLGGGGGEVVSQGGGGGGEVLY